MNASPREHLLSISDPAITEPLDALRLIAALECEPEPESAYERAARDRRRAFIWSHTAELWPEFESIASLAVDQWQRSEIASDLEAVGKVTAS